MSGRERTVFLVGFMGCGKTVVGARLARSLGWEFQDTDAEIERREGRSIEQMIHAAGEDRFRAAERDHLESLAGLCRVVVACGGGLFLGYRQRRWLRAHGRTVWLDVPLEVARERIGRDGPGAGGRPLWPVGDPVAQRALYERRRATYALADLRIDAGAGDPAEVARLVEQALRTAGWEFLVDSGE